MEYEGPVRANRRLVPVETMTVALVQPGALAARGIVSNVSERGACLITNTAIERGRRVRLTLSSRRSELFQTEALVAWCREGIDRIKEIVGVMIGVAFVDVSPELHQTIQGVLDSESFQEIVPPDAGDPDDVVHTGDTVPSRPVPST